MHWKTRHFSIIAEMVAGGGGGEGEAGFFMLLSEIVGITKFFGLVYMVHHCNVKWPSSNPIQSPFSINRYCFYLMTGASQDLT